MSIKFFFCFVLQLILIIAGGPASYVSEPPSVVDSSGESKNHEHLQHHDDVLRAHMISTSLKDALQYASGYREAKPFAHFTVLDIFPKDVLRGASREIRDSPTAVEGCVDGGACQNNGGHDKSHIVFGNVGSFGPATDALHKYMHSRPFLKYLELATGIDGLVTGSADSDAGVHQFLPGGFEKVHADFNKDKQRALHRRVSAYLYLNPQWKDEYGGHLELWSRDLQHCEAHISPDLGRLVVFASTDFSYHGHPSPLTCPPNRSNRMLAMHYYTPGRPSHECLNGNCFKDHHERYPATLCSTCAGVCTAG